MACPCLPPPPAANEHRWRHKGGSGIAGLTSAVSTAHTRRDNSNASPVSTLLSIAAPWAGSPPPSGSIEAGGAPGTLSLEEAAAAAAVALSRANNCDDSPPACLNPKHGAACAACVPPPSLVDVVAQSAPPPDGQDSGCGGWCAPPPTPAISHPILSDSPTVRLSAPSPPQRQYPPGTLFYVVQKAEQRMLRAEVLRTPEGRCATARAAAAAAIEAAVEAYGAAAAAQAPAAVAPDGGSHHGGVGGDAQAWAGEAAPPPPPPQHTHPLLSLAGRLRSSRPSLHNPPLAKAELFALAACWRYRCDHWRAQPTAPPSRAPPAGCRSGGGGGGGQASAAPSASSPRRRRRCGAPPSYACSDGDGGDDDGDWEDGGVGVGGGRVAAAVQPPRRRARQAAAPPSPPQPPHVTPPPLAGSAAAAAQLAAAAAAAAVTVAHAQAPQPLQSYTELLIMWLAAAGPFGGPQPPLPPLPAPVALFGWDGAVEDDAAALAGLLLAAQQAARASAQAQASDWSADRWRRQQQG